MPIVTGNIQMRLSGGSGNTDPNASLGGVMSSTAVVNAVVDNLFDSITAAEALAGDTSYRGIYFRNNNASLTLRRTYLFTAGALTLLSFGFITKNTDLEVIADEYTAPAGITFQFYNNIDKLETFQDLGPAEYMGVWVRRISPSSSTAQTPSRSITLGGVTAP
jgi:hypothetical protein